MKNSIKSFIVLTIIGFSITFLGCKKDNDTNLNYQAPGNYGNGNIQNTNFTGQIFTNVIANNDWELTLNDPYITQAVLSSGLVNVYMQPEGGVDTTSWYIVPATLPAIYQSAKIGVVFGIGKVKITSTASFSVPANLRVVIISAARKAQHPTVNYANYQEVKKVFHLKD